MSLMAWINYSFIVIFFIIAGVFIVLIARPRQQDETTPGSAIQHDVHQETTTYFVLAALCMFLVYIAWAAYKYKSPSI